MPSPEPTVTAEPSRAAVLTDAIEEFLREVVAEFAPDAVEARRTGPGRPRVLPALALWTGLLVCVVRGFTSQQALWRLLSGAHLWWYPRFPVTDQAVYKRLATAGTAPLERLFQQVSAVLAERLAPYQATTLASFAADVVALDATTLDRVARSLPALRGCPPGAPALLPGKLAGVFDLRRQQWRTVRHLPDAQENDKVAARRLLADLLPGTLIVADLGYFAFAWFDELTAARHFWVSRLRAKTSYSVQHVFVHHDTYFDGVIWLGAYRNDRAAHAVRLIEFRVQGQPRRYLTNVLDPRVLPAREVAQIYARRWDIELAFKLIKRDLKLHLLWSAKTDVILQQLWAVLILAQILQALRLEVAGRAGVDPFDVSLPLLVEYFPRIAADGRDPVAVFVEHGRDLGFIRPSRRTVIEGPDLPADQLHPLPDDVVLLRAPRYGPARSGPHLTSRSRRPSR